MQLENYKTTGFQKRESALALSAFMSGVYLWMAVGITISGLTAFLLASRPELVANIITNRPLFFGLIIAQFGLVFLLTSRAQSLSVQVASALYATYATLIGVTFSTIFLIYTKSSIVNAFFITGFGFAGLSLVAYKTKRDLSPIGSFCIMGLFGLIGMMLVSFFFPATMNNTMQIIFSVVGLLIFSGLTAYDTQKIKAMQYQYTTALEARKGSIFGALILYLDFINLFMSILRLTGSRR